MLKNLATASKAKSRLALVIMTLASIILSVILSILALWSTTSGNPDALIPESKIWTDVIMFSILIPGVVCPLVVRKLLNTLRELHEARTRLDAIARQDHLTGLLNRRGFDDAAAALIEQAVAHRLLVSALLCDIDHFKRINDTYGHECGDMAICHVANLLRTISLGDTKVAIGRQGGEEFAIVFAGRSREDLASIAEEIRSTVASTPFTWSGMEIHVRISLGTSMSQPAAATVRSLLSRADAALYEAKKQGRNCVVDSRLSEAA